MPEDTPSVERPSRPGSVLAWLQLLRLPAVFTALSNVLCGYLLTQTLRISDLPAEWRLWLLMGASASLYLSGMTLNDVCDAELDARERPERPIPSGRISRRDATLLSGGLMMIGLVLASGVSRTSLALAAGVACAVVLYDAVLKSTVAAPLGMALCRFLNFLLASSAVTDGAALERLSVQVATGLAIYVAGVTLFARNESGRSHWQVLLSGFGCVLAGLAVHAWTIGTFGANSSVIAGSRMALLLLALNLGMRASAAISQPEPARVQKTVGLMLQSLILLDAILVFAITGDARLAAAVVMLIPPAILLRRVIPIT